MRRWVATRRFGLAGLVFVSGCAIAIPRAPSKGAPITSAAASTSADLRGPTSEHPAAVARLLDSSFEPRSDAASIVTVPLPDGAAWTRVRYWTVTQIVGWRYGDEHHAAVAVFAFPPSIGVDGRDVHACLRRFGAWGARRGKVFDVFPGEARTEPFAWGAGGRAGEARVLDVVRRTLFGHRTYAAVYAAFPAWKESCLVVGFAVPESESETGPLADHVDAASALRDRFVAEALPHVIASPTGASEALRHLQDVGD